LRVAGHTNRRELRLAIQTRELPGVVGGLVPIYPRLGGFIVVIEQVIERVLERARQELAGESNREGLGPGADLLRAVAGDGQGLDSRRRERQILCEGNPVGCAEFRVLTARAVD
jgi:hypothetical protein